MASGEGISLAFVNPALQATKRLGKTLGDRGDDRELTSDENGGEVGARTVWSSDWQMAVTCSGPSTTCK
jgi:hypothetical protein